MRLSKRISHGRLVQYQLTNVDDALSSAAHAVKDIPAPGPVATLLARRLERDLRFYRQVIRTMESAAQEAA